MDSQTSYHGLVRHDATDMLSENLGVVLDLGGGIGATSAALKRSGRAERTVLFDQVAHQALPEIDAAVSLDLDNPDAIAAALVEHGPFDTVLCLDILEHLRDPWRTMKLLGEATRPDGMMVVSLPNVTHYSVLAPLVFNGRFRYAEAGILDRTHLRWFTREGAIELASCSGLVAEKVEVNLAGRKVRYGNTLTLGTMERFLASQYRILLRKR